MIRLLLLIVVLATTKTFAQTIWNGPEVTFSKVATDDPTLEVNQDRITDKVWITRGGAGQVYNAVLEASFNKENSPLGTLWAFGTTADTSALDFKKFRELLLLNPLNIIGKDMVMKLVEEDIFIDIKFAKLGKRPTVEVEYTRSSEPIAGINDENSKSKINVFPNPSVSKQVSVSGLVSFDVKVSVLSSTSEVVLANPTTTVSENSFTVDLSSLSKGVYFLKIENGEEVITEKVVLN